MRRREARWMAAVIMVAGLVACARPRATTGGDSAPAEAGDDTMGSTIIVEGSGWTRVQRDSATAALERQRSRWAGQRPPAYRYVIAGTCFCLTSDSPQVVTVRDGRAVARPDTGGMGDSARSKRRGPGHPPFGTDGIDALFDSLMVAVRDTAIDAVRIDYDERWGFPRQVTLDRIARAVDDEYHIEVSRFEAQP